MNTAHFDVRTLNPGDLFYVGTVGNHLGELRRVVRVRSMLAVYEVMHGQPEREEDLQYTTYSEGARVLMPIFQ